MLNSSVEGIGMLKPNYCLDEFLTALQQHGAEADANILSECSVCFDPYKVNDQSKWPALLDCGHTYCTTCIYSLTRENGTSFPSAPWHHTFSQAG
jgi:hypothetical protein